MSSTTSTEQRRRLPIVAEQYFPAYTVWELTLRCDQPCAHCGSRAGKERPDELTTDKALTVADELAALGAREVVLIGGEAYLHPGFLAVIRRLAERGVTPVMTTGGRGITAALAKQMKEAGLARASVSVDGLAREHNLIRKAPGSFESAIAALGHLARAGIGISANTNVNRVNAAVLEDLFALLASLGVRSWQVQITVPLGRAADRPQMLLQPYDLLDVVPRVARLKEQAFARGILVMPGNNLGYFGPEEALLRSPRPGMDDHWMGCQAGRLVLGIESDGGVKGCPSLQPAYVGGSLKTQTLAEVWRDAPALAFTRGRTVDALWGWCSTCPFAATCLGGCSFTAHAVLGRPGNNPFCHFRARTLARDGLRERLVPTDAAPGTPFDHGLFRIVVEPLDAPEPHDPSGQASAGALVAITRAPRR